MKNKIIVNKDYAIGTIEREVWGSFVEHMGRSVYGGIYEPTHATADGQGFRRDVLSLVRALNVPVVRYPGGNFLSGYDWMDGIGKDRPVNLDLAWGQLEPNKVGIHEFADWAKKAGAEIMMSVNMGTGTPKEAGRLVEYCNHPSGTRFSDMRIANGRKEPFGIKRWCIGNEMDGDWQICTLTAEEYGRKARETAKIMRWVDRDVKLVVCGSSGPTMPSYPVWDRVVLEHTYDLADYISLHRYYTYNKERRMEDFLASGADLEKYIRTVASTADYVKALRRSNKTMWLSVDEWNVWHTEPVTDDRQVSNDVYEGRWTVGPRRVENVYDMADALAFAGLMCALINNADRVKMGCLAQLVNVIAPVYTENDGRVLRQTIYYPYQTAIRYAKGTALQPVVKAETADTEYGTVPVVTASVCYDESDETYALFIVNKSEKAGEYELSFSEEVSMCERIEMKSENVHDANTFDCPDKVVPARKKTDAETKRRFEIALPAYSFSVLRFQKA